MLTSSFKRFQVRSVGPPASLNTARVSSVDVHVGRDLSLRRDSICTAEIDVCRKLQKKQQEETGCRVFTTPELSQLWPQRGMLDASEHLNGDRRSKGITDDWIIICCWTRETWRVQTEERRALFSVSDPISFTSRSLQRISVRRPPAWGTTQLRRPRCLRFVLCPDGQTLWHCVVPKVFCMTASEWIDTPQECGHTAAQHTSVDLPFNSCWRGGGGMWDEAAGSGGGGRGAAGGGRTHQTWLHHDWRTVASVIKKNEELKKLNSIKM